MCDQDTSSIGHERSMKCVVEDPFGGMGIDSAQDIIEKNMTGLAVQCTSQRDTLLLTSRQRYTFLSYYRLVTVVEYLEISLQRASLDDILVALLVEMTSEYNIVLDYRGRESCLLG